MKKNVFNTIIIGVLLLICTQKICAFTSIQGSGTSMDPYKITSYADLKEWRDGINCTTTNATYASAYYVITQNITITDAWVSIGNSSSTPFKGYVYGQVSVIAKDGTDSVTVSQITFSSLSCGTHAALFGTLQAGRISGERPYIKNLTLVSDDNLVLKEGLAHDAQGYSFSHITTNLSLQSNSTVGAICSLSSECTFTSCINQGSVKGTGSGSAVGGLVGLSTSTLTMDTCINLGAVQGLGYNDIGSAVGGLIGKVEFASDDLFSFLSITESHSKGELSNAEKVGGLIGYTKSYNDKINTIEDSYNNGTISGNQYAGGLIAYNDMVLTLLPSTPVNFASISTHLITGGAIGQTNRTVTIGGDSGCLNMGSIEGPNSTTEGSAIGGIIGKSQTTTQNDVLTFDAYGQNQGVLSSAETIGGLVGYNTMALTISSGSINISTLSDANIIGGLVGYSEDSLNISNSMNVAELSNSITMGGIVGKIYYTDSDATFILSECNNNDGGLQTADTLGGLIGSAESSNNLQNKIINCTNNRSITDASLAGGLIAYNATNLAITCLNENTSSNMNGNSITCSLIGGGIVGKTIKTVVIDGGTSGVYSHSNIIGSGATIPESRIGGIIGCAEFAENDLTSYFSITNCHNTNPLQGAYYVGGLVGYAESHNDLQNSIIGGQCNGNLSDASIAGGFIAYNATNLAITCLNENTSSNMNGNSITCSLIGGGIVGKTIKTVVIDGDLPSIQSHASITGPGATIPESRIGGMIGCAEFAEDDLTSYFSITNCMVTNPLQGAYYVGGVIGYAESHNDLQNTITEGEIHSILSDVTIAGGYIGYNATNLGITCSATSSMVTDPIYCSLIGGGLVGKTVKTVTIEGRTDPFCYSLISGPGATTPESRIGGIIGCVEFAPDDVTSYFSINNCSSTATPQGGYYVGGLIGYATGNSSSSMTSTISQSRIASSISSGVVLGGIVGKLDPGESTTITQCVNVYNISNTSDDPNAVSAGILGQNERDATLSILANFASVSATTGLVAGLVGENTGDLDLSYALEAGTLSSGCNNTIIPISPVFNADNCYYDRDSVSSPLPNGKYTQELIYDTQRGTLVAFSADDWDLAQGYYPMPKPFDCTYETSAQTVETLTPETGVTIQYINGGEIFDTKTDQTTIQFPETSPASSEDNQFAGWSFCPSSATEDRTFAQDGETLYTEKVGDLLDATSGTSILKLYATRVSDCDYTLDYSVLDLSDQSSRDESQILTDKTVTKVIIEPTGVLSIASGVTLSTDNLILYGTVLNGLNEQPSLEFADGTSRVTVTKGWMYARITDNFDYSYLSLPYDCKIDEIYAKKYDASGEYTEDVVLNYGTNWVIKSYDPNKRAAHGQGTTNWNPLASTETLQAGKGYILGVTSPDKLVLYFKPKVLQTELQLEDQSIDVSESTQSTNTVDNNWNLCGTHFLGKIQSQKMNIYEQQTGHSDEDKVMVHIPNVDGQTFNYMNSEEEDFSLMPFYAFYTQAAASGSITVEVPKGPASLVKPYQSLTTVSPKVQNIFFKCRNEALNTEDKMGLSLSDSGSTAYKIGADYIKVVGYAQRPQIFTISDQMNLAYNDLSYADAVHLPMGFYGPQGNYTLSIDTTHLSGLQGVYLLDTQTGQTVNLMQQDYSFSVDTAQLTLHRFYINVEQTQQVPTDNSQFSKDGEIKVQTSDQGLSIEDAPLNSTYYLFDCVGRCVLKGQVLEDHESIKMSIPGVYVLAIRPNKGKTYTCKVVL